jgi:hypothetical protein
MKICTFSNAALTLQSTDCQMQAQNPNLHHKSLLMGLQVDAFNSLTSFRKKMKLQDEQLWILFYWDVKLGRP